MPTTTPLHDLVATRINQRWDAFAAAHPQLAKAIDRTVLVESTVARLRDDPAFARAMAQAELDEVQLAAVARVLDLAEKWIARALAVL
ncbi:MAG: hypothetical protein WD042_05725 [Phycisphaeraceae bacterium]